MRHDVLEVAFAAVSPTLGRLQSRHNRYRGSVFRRPVFGGLGFGHLPSSPGLRFPAATSGGSLAVHLDGTVVWRATGWPWPGCCATSIYSGPQLQWHASTAPRALIPICSAIEQAASTRYGSPFLTVPAYLSSHSFYEYGCHRIGVSASQNG